MADTTPLMPDGIAASKRSMPPPLPPLAMPPSPGGPSPALPMPPSAASAPPAPAPMAPIPGGGVPMPPTGPMGQPMAPPQPTIHDLIPGIQSTIQDNGKILVTAPPLTPGGAPQVIDVLDAPRIPKALQTPKPQKPQGP